MDEEYLQIDDEKSYRGPAAVFRGQLHQYIGATLAAATAAVTATATVATAAVRATATVATAAAAATAAFV